MKSKIFIILSAFACLILLTNSCKKNDTPPVSIGQIYQGGRVAYILQSRDAGYDPNVQHGLIAAVYDQSTGIQWYNGVYLNTGAYGIKIGTGKSNTSSIIASQGAGSYAASLCAAPTFGGYTDWYLPSIGELYELYLEKDLIGGFASGNYWSSSQWSDYAPWCQNFSNGTQSDTLGKQDTAYVRAVRSF